jgi:hypothetical protein
MRTRSAVTGLLLGAGSLAGAVLYRRRAARQREWVDIYFADGSMASLPQGSTESDRMLRHAREMLAVARAR